MTTQANRGRSSYGRSKPRFGAFVFGFLLAVLLSFLAVWAYLRFGHPPVAVADKPFPMEAQIVHVPMNARIAREMQTPPFGTGEDAFEAGAKMYMNSCAGCHGLPAVESTLGKRMYPVAPQLFKKHANSAVVGVSDDDPGKTFWVIRNGIRLTGMPSYHEIYTDAQMWQIALLLKNADQPLPDPVLALLTFTPRNAASPRPAASPPLASPPQTSH